MFDKLTTANINYENHKLLKDLQNHLPYMRFLQSLMFTFLFLSFLEKF